MSASIGRELHGAAFRFATRFDPQSPVRRGMARALDPLGPVRVSGGIGNGLLLRVSATHIQAFGLGRAGLEIGMQEALRRTVTPGCVVYDIGANLGFFALIAARLGAGAIHAFEPLPANVDVIRANLRLNPVEGDRVTVHPVAVSDASGQQELYEIADASWSHLAERGRHPLTTATHTVDVVALDDLALPAPAIIKLDVEGSEIHALEGMQRLLTDAAPILLIESHETNIELCDFLEPRGYTLVNLDGPEPVRDAGPIHILARRSARA